MANPPIESTAPDPVGGVEPPVASIIVPTRRRPEYLRVCLATVTPQARAADAEVIVVDDAPGGDRATRELARSHGAAVVASPAPGGVNAARNAGIDAARADLIVFVDDDVAVASGWLDAFLSAAREAPDVDVFGGPITAWLEGGGPRGCGRERPPITSQELGPADHDVDRAWGANLAIRRRAVERVGRFDAALSGAGDEEEWEQRYRDRGGRIRYVAAAALEHRRTGSDARLRSLALVGYRRGRDARRHDRRRGAAPRPRHELRTLAGTVAHVIRRRCALGLVSVAHSLGRCRATLQRRR